ncbi:hypothetical protein SAMN05216605_114181 [Pseudomonas abietaniphila]|uniref:Uncharacterized protein n=1 Tax=Pseudomonas abietaniphila TaxID=89065 RepID=A0A1G8LLB8_9PSED|nr:hypothetical protein SAMN05216605_114181 [Pseudomonas abietaniphila]
MSSQNKVYGKISGAVVNDEDSSEPLRLSDLFKFLNVRKRSTSCPHCDHRGAWEISMQEESDNEENPRLLLFKMESTKGEAHTSIAMNCPNCGHLAQISTYKIREFLAGDVQPWAK